MDQEQEASLYEDCGVPPCCLSKGCTHAPAVENTVADQYSVGIALAVGSLLGGRSPQFLLGCAEASVATTSQDSFTLSPRPAFLIPLWVHFPQFPLSPGQCAILHVSVQFSMSEWQGAHSRIVGARRVLGSQL